MRKFFAFLVLSTFTGILSAFPAKKAKNIIRNGNFEKTSWLIYGIEWVKPWTPFRTRTGIDTLATGVKEASIVAR